MEDWVAKRGLALIEPKRLRQLGERSDARGLLQLASQLGAIALTGTGLIMSWGSWWGVPVFLAHGVLINCLYAGQHEMSHWTAFKSRWLNNVAGEAIGFIVIYPFTWDRWFHFAHVHWLNDDQRAQVVAEARWYIAGYIGVAVLSLLFQSWLAVELWLAPMLATKAFHQLQNIGEHTGLTHHPDTLKNTRTLTGPAWLRWLMWNMSYHTAHHTFPGVPFHALPALHREIEQRLGETLPCAAYLECHRDIVRSLSRGAEQLEPVR